MYDPNNEQSLPQRLRVARERSGYTVEDLAGRLGVMAHSIEAWERGDRDPRANRLMHLAGLLGVSLGWLLEGSEDGLPPVDETTTLETLREELEIMDGQLGELRERVQLALASIDQVGRRLRRGDAEEVIGDRIGA